MEEDPSVVFPHFYDQPSVQVGEQGGHFELDGESLRAVLIATHDFLPARVKRLPCGNRLESQRYHLIRQGDIIFVYIYADADACGGRGGALDSGAKYAINTEGRILRRLFDGQPETPGEGLKPEGETRGVPAKPGVVPGYEPRDAPPAPASPREGGSPAEDPVQEGGALE